MSTSALQAAHSSTLLTLHGFKNLGGTNVKQNPINEYLGLDCSSNKDMLLERDTQGAASSASGSSLRKQRHNKENMVQAQDQDTKNSSNIPNGSNFDLEMLNLDEALSYVERLPSESLLSVENIECILYKCKQDKNPSQVLRLHAYLSKRGLEVHSSLGNEMVSMLVDINHIHDAHQVFDKLVHPNESSWNSLISGYVKSGEPEAAFMLYKKWQADNFVIPSVHTLVALITACAKLKDLEEGSRLHADVVRAATFERDLFVGSSLVDMYAKCGCLAKAHEVFDGLSSPDVALWNALIAGYAKQRRGDEACKIFYQMENKRVSSNAGTYVCVLAACESSKSVYTGQKLHAEIARKRLLLEDLRVSNALIRMYAKSGFLAKAEEVFNCLLERDVVSWNAIMAAYCQHKHGEKVLSCLKRMQLEGISPDAYSLCCSLKACGIMGAADEGRKLHAEIDRKGLLKRDLVLGNALIDMYAQCGLLENAQEVFDKLPCRDIVSWNALMTGYVNNGLGEKALLCYKGMKAERIYPNEVSFICALKACGSVGAFNEGQEIHTEISRQGLEQDLLVGSSLVDMYAKCGLVEKAQEVFDKLRVRDVVLWNALISGYANYEHGEKALLCLERMQREGSSPNAVTYVCSLRACGDMRALERGEELHDEVVRKGLLERHLVVGNAVVDMYAKCGSLTKAQEVLDKLPFRDVISWNTLISGYVQHDRGKEALLCFKNMQREGVSPDATTYACSLKACGIVGAIDEGKEIHAEIAKKGLLLKRDLHLFSSLVDMYVKCGLLAKAQEVFDELPVRDKVSWNALISGYSQHECGEQALSCFAQMRREGIAPDAITYVSCLKACGSVGAADKGQEIDAEISKEGLWDRDLIIGNALVEMYAKCGLLTKAGEVLGRLSARDAFSWNALIAGFVNQEFGEEALNCVEQMQHEGISPDAITLIYIMKACSLIGATGKGLELYADIAREGLFETNLNLGVALLDMYAKSGLITKAQEVFYRLPARETVAWNALLTGFALVGESRQVFLTFDKMLDNGEKPSTVTFVSVLNSCSHAGLVDRSEAYFKVMNNEHSIIPELEHYNCMVDLLSRAGQLEEAVVLVSKIPFHSNLVVWHILLSACRLLGHVDLGRYAFEQAVKLDEKDDSAFICMANIYKKANMLKFAREIESLRVKNQAVEMLEHTICSYADDNG